MYAKIFDSVFESSLFDEPPIVRFFFFCMLIACRNIDGEVFGTPKGLARKFNLTEEEVLFSLYCLQRPDPQSTSKAHGGARIIQVAPNRWKIVNFEKYATLRDPEFDSILSRRRVTIHRAKKANGSSDTNDSVTPRNQALRPVTLRYTALHGVTSDCQDGGISLQDSQLSDIHAGDNGGPVRSEDEPPITNTLGIQCNTVSTEKKESSTHDTASCSSESDTYLHREEIGSAEPKRRQPQVVKKDDGEPVLTFPTVGTEKQWTLTKPFLEKLRSLYPSLDILAEARKALAWCIANPGRRKTARGMARFLINWLNKAADRVVPTRRESLLTPVFENPEEGFKIAYAKAGLLE